MLTVVRGLRRCAVGWGTAPQAGRSRFRFPMESEIFDWLHHSGRTNAMGSSQPLAEISTKDLPWRVWAAGDWGSQRCHFLVPTVWKFWEPQPPGALGAYLGLYRDSFTFSSGYSVARVTATFYSPCPSCGRLFRHKHLQSADRSVFVAGLVLYRIWYYPR